jgi:hypothetical protein
LPSLTNLLACKKQKYAGAVDTASRQESEQTFSPAAMPATPLPSEVLKSGSSQTATAPRPASAGHHTGSSQVDPARLCFWT